MKLTEFIQWVTENPDQVVKDSGGAIRMDYPGVMAYWALIERDRLKGETERLACSVAIPRHSPDARKFFTLEFDKELSALETLYSRENREFGRFLWKAIEKQNTRMIALAFQEITPEEITESINKYGCNVDPFVAYWKYAKAFKVIEYVRGEGLHYMPAVIDALLCNPALYVDCSFCKRWVNVALDEWNRKNELSVESILFNIRVQIFEAAQRACFKNRELIPAAQKMLYTLGIRYEPKFSV
nr:MAG TPA: hypothetical protein [Caudoviricetes sp.]